MERSARQGLRLIDDPESALSPARQPDLLAMQEAVALEDTRHYRLYRAFCLDPQGFVAEELRHRRDDD